MPRISGGKAQLGSSQKIFGEGTISAAGEKAAASGSSSVPAQVRGRLGNRYFPRLTGGPDGRIYSNPDGRRALYIQRFLSKLISVISIKSWT